MLDNLVNADLSGLKGNINYTYDSFSQVVPSVIMSIAALFFIFILLIIVINVFKERSTYGHRKKLLDMYVSGMIRKFAKEDDIDLEAEYKYFIKEEKREKLYRKELDVVVEKELSEKIIAQNEKKIDEINKKK